MIAIDNTGAGAFRSDHEVVLQGLSQWLPFHGPGVPGGKVFYHADAFAPTADAWNQVPILFVPPGLKPLHPDHAALARDPEGTARALGYRIVGNLKNTRVSSSQMVADAVLGDAHAAQLARDGRLGLSTGFDAAIRPDGRIAGSVVPNHLLVFLKCPAASHCGTGNDPAAAFNNLAQERRMVSKDLSEMEAEQQRDRDARNARPMEHGVMMPESFREQAADREANAIEMIKARGKIDPATGQFRDFRSCEGPE